MHNPQSPTTMDRLSKFGAYYYAGLTIEADPDASPPTLKIDGQKIDVTEIHRPRSFEAQGVKRKTLFELAQRIVDILWDRKKRERIRRQHLAKLRKGRDSWNRWRRRRPEIRPLLFGTDLRNEHLEEFNFCNANLIEADLRKAHLEGANFHEANLGRAQLSEAHLERANFCRTDLYETDLSGAYLNNANLQGTQLARTDLRRAHLIECTIYGLSAWNLKLKDAEQKNLRILYKVEQENGEWDQGEFVVQDLEVAQFVFLLLDNTRIHNFFNTMTSKAVVIMGRFSPQPRMAVLDGLRRDLRKEQYLPIVFDFARPEDRDLVETIKTLVGLCRFAIVDITEPRSSPLELDATVKDYQVPFVPIIKRGKKREKPFSMFNDLRKYNWMLRTVSYESKENLSLVTKPLIIDRALEEYNRIQRIKARPAEEPLQAEGYLASLTKKSVVSERLSRNASSPSVRRERR